MSKAHLAFGGLLLAASFSGCGRGHLRAAGEDGEIVEAEGWAPIAESDVLGTKQRSLSDAEKKAVEKVVGVYISAKTRVDAAVDVEQRIMADVDGYIARYEILGERKDEGFLKTRIRALVLHKKVGDDLKQLGLMRPPPSPGNPRVAVALADASAAKGLRDAMARAGFNVVDRVEDADLTVGGQAQVHPLDSGYNWLHSARARLTLEAVKAKTGEVLASRSQEASSVDPVEGLANGKALELAGSMAGDALAKDLSSMLKARVDVAVRVDGLKGLEQVRAIEDDIRLNPEVSAVTLSSYERGSADLRVVTDNLAGADLSALILRDDKLKLAADSVSAYEVRLRAR